jgi:hypothetical protein
MVREARMLVKNLAIRLLDSTYRRVTVSDSDYVPGFRESRDERRHVSQKHAHFHREKMFAGTLRDYRTA